MIFRLIYLSLPNKKTVCTYSIGSDGQNFSWKRKNGATKRTGDKSIPKLIDEIPYPSLAGTGFEENPKADGDVKTGSSPGSDSSPCQTFPESFPVAFLGGLLLQWRDRSGFYRIPY